MADMQKFDQAVDQVILDSERLHTVVNGDAITSATAEDGSPLPSIRKAMLDNLYFKTPLIPWSQGTLVREYNQLYLFTDSTGRGSWWYAPSATQSHAVQMGQSPMNDPAWRVFADSASMGDLYAPITSPIFKGNPQANTPVKGDDSNSLATTEFVTDAVADLKAEIGKPLPLNTFENLTVTNETLLNKLHVTGDFLVESPKLTALRTAASFNTLDLFGEGAHLTFTQNGSNPGASKTDIGPWKIVTHELVVDELTATTGEFGNADATDPGLVVHGQANVDYLHVTGNSSTEVGVPRLVVDGITQVENLVITGVITGLKADVDGLDIAPKSVTTDTVTSGDVTVHNDLTVSGKTSVGDLEVTGEITGITLSVDGKIIRPRQVLVTEGVSVGTNLSVGGTTTIGDLVINGTVTGLQFPEIDVTGLDITPRSVTTSANSTFAATTTVRNLVVTGTVTGVPTGNVDGLDITPRSVDTEADIDVGGELHVVGITVLKDTTVDNLTVNEKATITGDAEVGETLTVNNLVVTGTATGDFGTGGGGDVDGKDIKPKSVTLAGTGSALTTDATTDVNLGKLAVAGVSALKETTATKLTVSTGDTTVGSLIVNGAVTTTSPSNTLNLNTATVAVSGDLTVAGKTTLKDLEVTGTVTGISANVDGTAIAPDTVEATNWVRANELGSTLDTKVGRDLTVGRNASITGTLTATGNATLKNVVISGTLTDSDGNPIGSAESISGKDITPRSVVAQVNVKAATLESTGATNVGGKLTVVGDTAVQDVTAKSIVTTGGVTVGGSLRAKSTDMDSLIVGQNVVGATGDTLSVKGNTLLTGDLVVTGMINGNVDLSAKNVNVQSLVSASTISATGAITSSTSVSANTVTAGSSDQTKVGLNVLNNAHVTGDLTVDGSIKGSVNLDGKPLAPSSLTTPTVTVSDKVTTKDLTVTGTLTMSGNSLVTDNMQTKKYSVTVSPDITISSATWTPDGSTNIYNVIVQNDVVIQPIANLSGGATYFIYVEQDSTGGHAVTFHSNYVQMGTATVGTGANAVTLVQVVYRGRGTLLDVVVTPRT